MTAKPKKRWNVSTVILWYDGERHPQSEPAGPDYIAVYKLNRDKNDILPDRAVPAG